MNSQARPTLLAALRLYVRSMAEGKPPREVKPIATVDGTVPAYTVPQVEELISEMEKGALPSPQGSVHTLVLSTQYGTEAYLFRELDDALDFLYAFVKEWWSEVEDSPHAGEGPMPIPEDVAEACDFYFGAQPNESYQLTAEPVR